MEGRELQTLKLEGGGIRYLMNGWRQSVALKHDYNFCFADLHRRKGCSLPLGPAAELHNWSLYETHFYLHASQRS